MSPVEPGGAVRAVPVVGRAGGDRGPGAAPGRACGRSPVGSAGRRRRSAVSCAATLRSGNGAPVPGERGPVRRPIARARRPKTGEAGRAPAAARVRAGQAAGDERWSPEQIARRLPVDFPDDEQMRISHEAIYQVAVRAGPRRAAPGADRAACAPGGRCASRGDASTTGASRITDKVLISERPAEVADRAVPGHWEGDLIIGADSGSAIGTLVERTTRFTMLLHLPDDHGAEAVRDAIATTITTLPEAPAPHADLGPGHRAGPARRRSRFATDLADLLLRPAQPLAARHATRTPTGCCASTSPKAPTCPCTARTSSPRRRRPQRPTPQDPRLEDPSRSPRPTTVSRTNNAVLRRPPESAAVKIATSWRLCTRRTAGACG